MSDSLAPCEMHANIAAAIACGCVPPRGPCGPGTLRIGSPAEMQGLVIRWFVSATALYLTSLIVRGIEIHGIFPLLFAAVTIGILNAVVRPFILLLTLPLNLLTLGLFTLVVNAGMLWMASKVVVGFEVHGFWSAVGGWLLMSFFTFLINLLIGESGQIEMVSFRRVVRY